MANAVRARSRLHERAGFAAALGGGLRGRLIQPLFVFSATEEDERHAIPSLPGQYLLSITESVREARAAARAGIAGVLLLAAPDRKDESALLAAERDWIVPRAIRAMKDAVPELGVATDVCVCAYTSHGQCVLFHEGTADVAATLSRLGEIAVAHAEAGADLVVLSGMLDGSVAAVRRAFADAGHADVGVAGVVKFASSLYGPYRDALGLAPLREWAVPLLAPAEVGAAIQRGERHLEESADLIVVKPSLVALDVVAALHQRVPIPTAAFHVAGEYAMLRALEESTLPSAELFVEAARGARRAGADLLISYAGIETAELLEDE